MRRALVTGGSGFIGSNIVRLLLDRGVEVRVLDDFSSGFRENLDGCPSVEVFEADIRDVERLDRAMAGADAVFHLAASVGNARSIADPVADSDINVMGTLRVLEAARRHGVRKVVFSSSAGIFGELKVLPIREDHPAEPDSPYGASKLAAEKLCLVYAKLYGLECVCLRYFNVYGLNQRYDAYGNVIPIFAHRALHGLPLAIYGDGEQTRDFVNVRDVAAANYQAAATAGLSGAFNIASGTGITINRLAALVVELTGSSSTIEHAGPRQGDVRHSVADISAASAAFAFQPAVSLLDGLGDYLTWAKRVAI
jgi:UDP-glucose 4-epimerase